MDKLLECRSRKDSNKVLNKHGLKMRNDRKVVEKEDLLFKVNIRIDENRSAKVEFSSSDKVEDVSNQFCKVYHLDGNRKKKIEKMLINLKQQYVNDF